ncbi:hypothetical protein [Streptomyces shenzhenensis]|uniref:hypothetical protein n=1 Tax=Streptomyces shenzhenensis TaxID=943815 RepID=UPI0033CAFD2E
MSFSKALYDFAVSYALRLVKGTAGEDTLLERAGKSAEVFKDEFGDALTDFWPKLERAQVLADRALDKPGGDHHFSYAE